MLYFYGLLIIGVHLTKEMDVVAGFLAEELHGGACSVEAVGVLCLGDLGIEALNLAFSLYDYFSIFTGLL